MSLRLLQVLLGVRTWLACSGSAAVGAVVLDRSLFDPGGSWARTISVREKVFLCVCVCVYLCLRACLSLSVCESIP